MDDAAGPKVTVEDESVVPAGPWAEDGNQDCPAYHTAAFRMYVMKVGRGVVKMPEVKPLSRCPHPCCFAQGQHAQAYELRCVGDALL